MVRVNPTLKILLLLVCFNVILIPLTSGQEAAEPGVVADGEKSGHEAEHEGKLAEHHESEEDPTLGIEWCRFQVGLRDANGAHKSERCEDQAMKFDSSNLRSFLSIFVIIGWGAFVRSILKATGLNLPYTVILMISGLIIGAFSRTFCDELNYYTAIARTPPKIILFLFLPVLIFESAFSIPVHTFMRSVTQILVAAFPGMLIATMSTAAVCVLFLTAYKFTFTDATLFGSIISATDPVAVVAILRELGTSELLSVMIEGESLLNDGVAILLFEILEQITIEGEVLTNDVGGLILLIFKKFVVIAIGGPIFGWVCAKITIFCLSRIFNDATVEITITLVAAYLTYFIGDHMLGVSGVMAVVVLGLTMSSERTSISPEVESSVHHFWEMLGYLANTVLFVLVGIIITETAINNIQWHDLYYLIFIYIALNIIRLGMLMILAPLLKRIGYGLKWENLIVMMWGGLRGAVGLCLAIEVYNGEICEHRQSIGAPFLFQTAGVVFLTLVINGTTTKALLETLKLTEISTGRLQDMTNATKQLTGAQIRSLTMLKHDRFLADANWAIVERFTSISDPYKQRAPKPKIQDAPSIISLRLEEIDHVTECDACHKMVVNQPTHAEFLEMTEEARLRILKALKVSYWRQFEEGVLTELAVQILVAISETIEDTELLMIHTNDLRKYWTVRGFFFRVRKSCFKHGSVAESVVVPRRPSFILRRPFWLLATRDWFDGIILFAIVLNLIPVIWELVLLARSAQNGDEAFFYVNVAFTILYTLEFVVKIIGRGPKDYIKNKWNYMDVVVLILSYIEIALYVSGNSISKIFGVFRVARLVRIIRLPRYLWPKIHAFVERRLNEQLFLGYDVGKGFVTAVDDVLKFLPQMVDHKRILGKLRHSMENVRLETVREMGLLQKENPGIAIAVKTRHASRAILNQMRNSLLELKEDGLVDEKENETLTGIIEENMKRLWTSPSSIQPSPPEVLLANVSWVLGNDDLLTFIHSHATLLSFNFGDTICSVGDEPDGIYLIVSGMIKIHYQPNDELIEAKEKLGLIPNTELFLDMTFSTKEDDFFSTGTVLGELSLLTGAKRAASVTSETSVLAYHIPQAAMKKAMTTFNAQHDSLESRLWRACGIRLATALLPTQPSYQSWPVDKIRLHLERSAVPLGSSFEGLKFPEFVSDAILIQGQLKNYHKTKEVFTAPCLIPHSCVRVTGHPNNGAVPPRLLVVAHEDIDSENVTPSEESLLDYVVKASSMRKGVPSELSQLTTPRERRLSVNLNFGVRKKSQRKLAQKQSAKTIFGKRGPVAVESKVGTSQNERNASPPS